MFPQRVQSGCKENKQEGETGDHRDDAALHLSVKIAEWRLARVYLATCHVPWNNLYSWELDTSPSNAIGDGFYGRNFDLFVLTSFMKG